MDEARLEDVAEEENRRDGEVVEGSRISGEEVEWAADSLEDGEAEESNHGGVVDNHGDAEDNHVEAFQMDPMAVDNGIDLCRRVCDCQGKDCTNGLDYGIGLRETGAEDCETENET